MKKYIDEELLQQVILETKQQLYPVGSIYISSTLINPQQFFGFGEWEQIKDTFLVAAGSNFSAGTTGGSKTHQHDYGLQYGSYYGSVVLEYNTDGGLLNYNNNNKITISTEMKNEADASSFTWPKRTEKTALENKEFGEIASMAMYRHTAKTSNTDNLPPYLSVYMWKRIG